MGIAQDAAAAHQLIADLKSLLDAIRAGTDVDPKEVQRVINAIKPGGAIRSINVSRILDVWRCAELYRAHTLGLRSPLTVHGVTGDATHRLVAGATVEEVKQFVERRFARSTEEVRLGILQKAQDMARNADEPPPKSGQPDDQEKHVAWMFQGWEIHSQADRSRFIIERLGKKNKPTTVREFKDYKTTREVKDWHWDGVMLHALIWCEANDWKGPVKLTVHPLQSIPQCAPRNKPRPQSKYFSRELFEATKDRLRATLWQLERLWKDECLRLLQLCESQGLLTAEMAAMVLQDPYAIMATSQGPSFKKLLQADEVTDDNPFTPKSGRHCEECPRLGRCAFGQEFVAEKQARTAQRRAIRQPAPAVVEAEVVAVVDDSTRGGSQ